MNTSATDQELSGIAVIGISGRFPGASNVAEFWENIKQGVESITHFTDQELLAAGIPDALLQAPDYVKSSAILDDIEHFDAAFFGISPREAECMDPQHRLFLECAWEALESAGYDPHVYPGSIGVFAGASVSFYLLYNLMANRECWETLGTHQVLINNEPDHLAARVSYKLNLRGPSLAVQTACSTSLVAVHLGCQSLLHNECDMALAGGVSLRLPQKTGYRYQEGGILSPDGHCRAFDAEAKGSVGGSGAGIVVLKRLSDALADGDNVLAVIKGSAINNDGAGKVGYTAPSVQGQAAAICAAGARAGISFDSIRYVEAHGTGTQVGDPVEIAALTQAFRTHTKRNGYCALGSVKTNIGHLNAASGIVGLIKTILALKHHQLPPSLHFRQPNSQIDFANSPFYVNTTLAPWERQEHARTACVSNLGLGGTNAHIIVTEAPESAPSSPGYPWLLFPLSARTEEALEMAGSELAAYLRQHPDLSAADVAYTLQVGRHPFAARRVLLCRDLEEVVEELDNPSANIASKAPHGFKKRPILFLFPGQGTRLLNAGRDMYHHFPIFRETVDRCAALLTNHLDLDIRVLLYPEPDCRNQAAVQLKQTALIQPVLFVLEYALAQLWCSWGVTPQALLGHSLGEYTAACLSGVFSLETALWLIVQRGSLQQQTPPGSMIAVALSEHEVQEWLGQDLWLAAINGTNQCTLSGYPDAVDRTEAALRNRGIGCIRLATSHAFHSGLMDEIVEPFVTCMRQVELNPPQIPYLSNVTGTWIQPHEAMDAAYWGRHMREPVRFQQGLEQAYRDLERAALLEVGPGTQLSKLSDESARAHEGVVISSLPGKTAIETQADSTLLQEHAEETYPELKRFLGAVGSLWLAGVNIDWNKFTGEQRRRHVALPTYPFQRQRHWIDFSEKNGRAALPGSFLPTHQSRDMADWFYVPSWKRSPMLPSCVADLKQTESGVWIVFADSTDLSFTLIHRLEQVGQCVIVVNAATTFQWTEKNHVTINPQSSQDYLRLITEIAAEHGEPRRILHLWNIADLSSQATDRDRFAYAQEQGFYSLLYLAQALKHFPSDPVSLLVVGSGLCDISGLENLCPEKAPLLGLCTVLRQENPEIRCRCIDIPCAQEGLQAEWVIDQLLAETAWEGIESFAAYRGKNRLLPEYQLMPLKSKDTPIRTLRPEGVYLITGGLGRIGLALARHLAESVRARLILLGRTDFPAREEWDSWLATHQDSDPVSAKIRTLLALEEMGSRVSVVVADIADEHQMSRVLENIYRSFGTLHGIFHAAGLTGTYARTPLEEIVATTAERQFQAKVYGLYTLEALLRNRDIDFCILFGSNTSILGGFGRGAYGAANAFMNAFAADRSKHSHVPWLNINWDGWNMGASQVEALSSERSQDHSTITATEGIAALERILCYYPGGPIVVSSTDLHARVKIWLNPAPQRINLSPKHPAPREDASASRGGLQTPYVAPRNALEQTIVEIWQRLFRVEPIGIEDDFFDLNGHSLLAVRMMAEIQKTFGRKLPLQTLFQSATVATLAQELEASPESIQWMHVKPVTPMQTDRACIPLFCVAAAGVNSLGYATLGRQLGADQPLFVLQAPYSNVRQKPYTREELKELSTETIRQMHLQHPRGPYCLAGQCTGTHIAFEMARQLQEAGEEVPLLVSFDTWPEENTRTRFGWWLTGVERSFQQYKKDPSAGLRRVMIHGGSLAYRCLREWALLPLRPPPPDSWEARYWPGRNFIPNRYNGRMVILRTSKQQRYRIKCEEMGWGAWTTAGVEVHDITGEHNTFLREPYVREVAAILHRYLDSLSNKPELAHKGVSQSHDSVQEPSA